MITRERPSGFAWLAWLGTMVFVASLALLVFVVRGRARDLDGRYAGSPNHAWFEAQHNSLGQWCCNESDGHLYYGDYTLNQNGSVDVEGEHIDSYKVIKEANPTGTAVWWYLDGPNGRTTYCFAIGPGA